MKYDEELVKSVALSLLDGIIEIDKRLSSQGVLEFTQEGELYKVPRVVFASFDEAPQPEGDGKEVKSFKPAIKDVCSVLIEQLKMRNELYKNSCNNDFELKINEATALLYRKDTNSKRTQESLDKMFGVDEKPVDNRFKATHSRILIEKDAT